MTNNTKILRYDLERDLQLVFDQLDELKKAKGTIDLYKIFTNIDTSMLASDEKNALADLIAGAEKTGLSATERLEELESRTGYSVDSLIEGDYKESFKYDQNGEIEKHTAIGDINFETTYKYGPLIPMGETTEVAGSNVLIESSSKFISSEGRNVEVKKTYHYDAAENIVEINTDTIMGEIPPANATQ